MSEKKNKTKTKTRKIKIKPMPMPELKPNYPKDKYGNEIKPMPMPNIYPGDGTTEVEVPEEMFKRKFNKGGLLRAGKPKLAKKGWK